VPPLSGPVAVVGSRHGSPWPVAPVVRAILAAGGVVRTGCAPGVDAAARAAAPGAVVVSASAPQFAGLPRPVALAARTRAVVAGALALVVFPPASGVLGPGSALAVSCALERFIPVWVAGSWPGAGWQACTLAGVPGWLLTPAQPALF